MVKKVSIASTVKNSSIGSYLHAGVKILCIDPGLCGTGWAYYPALASRGEVPIFPSCWGVINSFIGGGWQIRSVEITQQLKELCGKLHPKQLVIEMPEIWTSGKSMASATRGDLFKLVYLIGQLSIGNGEFIPFMIAPREWKGQLPKEEVIRRIKKLCPNVGSAIGNHEADAVGMGLALQGVL